MRILGEVSKGFFLYFGFFCSGSVALREFSEKESLTATYVEVLGQALDIS